MQVPAVLIPVTSNGQDVLYLSYGSVGVSMKVENNAYATSR